MEKINIMGNKTDYGNTYKEVASHLSHPIEEPTKYGNVIKAIDESEFSLSVYKLNKNAKVKLNFNHKGCLFVEEGLLILKTKILDTVCSSKLEKRNVFKFPYKGDLRLFGLKENYFYVFQGKGYNGQDFIIQNTFEVRDKYWGKIESIVSEEDYAGKRIFMKQNSQSSLEYHILKKEAYFLQSGKLKIGLRVGRAKNKSVILNPGDVFVINRGLMHMRIALKDSVIFEISTKDDDKDSHLVEDGRNYVHREI